MGSQAIANKLAEWITSGRTAVGSHLPPTRTLANQFGVSLHTVGVALKQLEMQQLVECRPRQRAVVLSRTPLSLPEMQLKQVILYVNNVYDWNRAVHGQTRGGDWGASIAGPIEQELFAAGFSVTVMPPSGPDGPSLEQRLDRLGRTLHGAVCFAGVSNLELIDQMRRRDLPWVTINRPARRIDCNYVAADNITAGWTAGRLFAASDYRRVLLLAANVQRSISDSEKMAGFYQAYMESGLPTDGIRMIPAGSVYEMNGYRAARTALEEGFRPQGVFTAGDFLAAGAMHALADAGLRVPEDVGVIGSTGLESAAQQSPPLSVVAQPMREMGQVAGRMLLEMIREGTRRYAPRRIACPLILRESMKLSELARQRLNEDPDRNPLVSAL